MDAWALVPPADAARIRVLACVRDAVAAVPLEGGITNRNYRVAGPCAGPSGEVVVRLSDPESSLLAIDRAAERENSIRAAASGAAPPVVEHHPDGLLVVGWIDGPALTSADIGAAANWPRIAEALRLLHGGPAFVNAFDMFAIQARYLEVVQSRGYRLPERYLSFMPEVERLRAAMRVRPEPLVPCNNDLLPANLVDDGERLWVIDYEYSGNNEASFELGNIWSEASLDDDALAGIVAAYWGADDPAKVARARAWGLMSKVGWTLWASIQDAISPLDFDYWSWGMEKWERAEADLDTGVTRLIEAVT